MNDKVISELTAYQNEVNVPRNITLEDIKKWKKYLNYSKWKELYKQQYPIGYQDLLYSTMWLKEKLNEFKNFDGKNTYSQYDFQNIMFKIDKIMIRNPKVVWKAIQDTYRLARIRHPDRILCLIPINKYGDYLGY